MTSDHILVAEIGAAHGLRGEVRLWSFTADPLAVKNYGALEAEDGRLIEIETLRPSKDHLIARLRGVDNRTAAERLCKLKLYVPRERLPAPDDGEFYHADLIGLAVETSDGIVRGKVVAVHNFGAGDLIEVRPAEGGANVMLPFTDTIVPDVDIARGRLLIDPPEGVIETPPDINKASPPPLRGRSARSAGRGVQNESHSDQPPSLTLPRKGGGNTED